MRLTKALLAICASVPIIWASPLSDDAWQPSIRGPGTVRVLQTTVDSGMSKAEAMIATFRKHGKKIPAHLEAAVATAKRASVPTSNGNGNYFFYVSPVTLGGTTVQLIFDTGSPDLWSFSTLQPSDQIEGHTLYKAGHGKPAGGRFDIAYGSDGSQGAQGPLYQDTVDVGGKSVSMPFGAAKDVFGDLVKRKFQDGIFGLAYPPGSSCSPKACVNWFFQVRKSLANPLFTVTQGPKGEYDFGFVDRSKYKGDIAWSPVRRDLSSYFWVTNIYGYSVGDGEIVETKILDYLTAAVDTGSPDTTLPPGISRLWYKSVPSAYHSAKDGRWIFKCSDIPKIPNLYLYLGGKTEKAVWPGQYGADGPVPDKPGFCYGAIIDDDDRAGLIGSSFLRTQLTVFDASDSPRIGFALQKDIKV